MRCDEIRERFVELLYDEKGTPSASPELREHMRACPACRQELKELSAVRQVLRTWEDEPPLRPVVVPQRAPLLHSRQPAWWRAARVAAIAASVVLAFLALGNARISLNKDGFSFQTHWLPGRAAEAEQYTKTEVREIIRAALDDTEARMLEANRVMVLQGLDVSEAERYRDLRLIEARLGKALNKN
jgi:plasmid stability protein